MTSDAAAHSAVSASSNPVGGGIQLVILSVMLGLFLMFPSSFEDFAIFAAKAKSIFGNKVPVDGYTTIELWAWFALLLNFVSISLAWLAYKFSSEKAEGMIATLTTLWIFNLIFLILINAITLPSYVFSVLVVACYCLADLHTLLKSNGSNKNCQTCLVFWAIDMPNFALMCAILFMVFFGSYDADFINVFAAGIVLLSAYSYAGLLLACKKVLS